MNSSTPMTLATIGTAARSGIANWRVGVVWIAATLIPTAIVSVPLGQFLSAALDHSALAGEWARQWNIAAVLELIANSTEFAPVLAGAGVVAALFTMLLWPFLTAMIVASARDARPTGFVALLSGGVRAYGRMLRMLLWSAVPFGIAGAIGGSVLYLTQKMDEKAVLQSTGDHQQTAAMILLILLLALAHISIEAGRAQLAIDANRRSAVKAWWRGIKLIKARPAAAFGSYLALTIAGLILMALIGLIRLQLPHASLSGVLLALGLSQLIVIAAVWMRSSRLLALIQISASLDRS